MSNTEMSERSQLTGKKEEAYAASYVMVKNDAKELEEVAKISSLLDVGTGKGECYKHTEDLASNP
jgi:hypothetical protein